jgi:nucleoside-diphosphate-sugar epimerase
MAERKDVVIVTGSSGFIGRALVGKLAGRHAVVGLDRGEPPRLPAGASFERVDLTSDASVREALARVRERHGARIASVVHLAAYFDLSGEPSPKYEAITVRGTERLLRELRAGFEVEQFVFASTMLVHRAGRPGERVDEASPLDPKLPYRASKIATEQLIGAQRGPVPVVYLRPAGVYDDLGRNAFLARQIARIHEGNPKGRVYPGDLATGQSFLHLDDLADAVARLVERRRELPPELPLLLGEPEVMGYGELQREIGRLLRGEDWETWQVPRALAKAGAWVEEEVLGEGSFERP